MSGWIKGEYTHQFDLINNPDLYIEVRYSVEQFIGKSPWADREEVMTYAASLWMRLDKCRIDEFEIKLDHEHIVAEYGDLIQEQYHKISHLINFKEVE